MSKSEDPRHTPPKLSLASRTHSASSDSTAFEPVKKPAPPQTRTMHTGGGGLLGTSHLTTVRSSEIGSAEGFLAQASVRRVESIVPAAGIAAGKTSSESAELEMGALDAEAEAEAGDAPPDGGLEAWSVVLGCFTLAACQVRSLRRCSSVCGAGGRR